MGTYSAWENYVLRCVCSAAHEALGHLRGQERGGAHVSPHAQLVAIIIYLFNIIIIITIIIIIIIVVVVIVIILLPTPWMRLWARPATDGSVVLHVKSAQLSSIN